MTVTTKPRDVSTPPPSRVTRKGRGASAGDVGVNVFSHVVLIGWSVLVVVPFIWALVASTKTSREIFAEPWSLPASPQWKNFSSAWDKGVGDYLFNSLVVVTGGVVLTMLLGSMAAYVLARYEFKGNRFVYYLFAAGMMFPVFLAIVPLFFVVDNLGMLSTYRGLILVYTAYSLPFTVFFMHAFFRTLPTTIAEAAVMDGCSHTSVFFRVMLPMAKPGLLSVGLFNVLGQWNQFVLPRFLSPEKPVLAQGIANLLASQRYEGDWGALFAALTVAMVPVIVVYLVFYRQVQAGLTGGTLK
ncbi:MAG: carbohydrate ABC transporter permease [Nocardioidaceae bacterium]|nr:carbohydrate ABC transporter permease [Nocardioidaceae bacterium]